MPNTQSNLEQELFLDAELASDFTEEPVCCTDSGSPAICEHKLPTGARVSPLAPFFRARAQQMMLEKDRAKSLEKALSCVKLRNNRYRSYSQCSHQSESSSAVSSNDSTTSVRSTATAMSSIEVNELPSVPRIAFSEWSKFGISLFTPKLLNPHSQLYYHYPSVPNRIRSKSSATRRPSPQDSSTSQFQYLSEYPSERLPTSVPIQRTPLRRATLDRAYTSQ